MTMTISTVSELLALAPLLHPQDRLVIEHPVGSVVFEVGPERTLILHRILPTAPFCTHTTMRVTLPNGSEVCMKCNAVLVDGRWFCRHGATPEKCHPCGFYAG